MSIGQMTRKIFGKHFYVIGRLYRSIFVDLRKVASSISPHIPPESLIIDIGGGDGEPLNYLLSLRNDIKVKIIDQSLNIGKFIKPEYSSRVELLPGMSMGEFAEKVQQKPDVVLISDVLHHIPCEMRKKFLLELKTLILDKKKGMRIIIKDIEPGYFRSQLSLFSDRYISGDKKVSLIGRKELTKIMLETFGNSITVQETDLFKIDKPNYILVFIS